jgi:rubrerythrin
MPLSKGPAARPRARYVTETDTARPPSLGFDPGGTWYCAGCGKEVGKEQGDLRCPACGKLMNDLVRILVELHCHRPVT